MLTRPPKNRPRDLEPWGRLPDSAAPGPWQAMASLVVGFDRDDASKAALHFAVGLGLRLQARLHVVHVINRGDFPIDPDRADWEAKGAQTLAAEQAYVARVLRGYAPGWSYDACHGDPVATLAAAAEEHDSLFLIVGRHMGGPSGLLHRLAAGSVSRRLPSRSARPILVVPVRSTHPALDGT